MLFPVRAFRGPIDKRSNDDLFTIDKGTTEVRRAKKGLRIDQILAPNKHVKVVPRSRMASTSLPVALADQRKIARKAEFLKTQAPAATEYSEKYDIWSVGDEPKRSKNQVARAPSSAVIPAVEIEGNGASYNPSPAAHQALIQHLADKELEKERARQRVTRNAPKTIFSGNALSDATQSVRAELTAPEEVEEEQESEARPKAVVTDEKRKTRAQRNREERVKAMLEEQERTKEAKRIVKDIGRLSAIQKEIVEKEKKSAMQAERAKAIKEERDATRIPRLGPFVYVVDTYNCPCSSTLTQIFALIQVPGKADSCQAERRAHRQHSSDAARGQPARRPHAELAKAPAPRAAASQGGAREALRPHQVPQKVAPQLQAVRPVAIDSVERPFCYIAYLFLFGLFLFVATQCTCSLWFQHREPININIITNFMPIATPATKRSMVVVYIRDFYSRKERNGNVD